MQNGSTLRNTLSIADAVAIVVGIVIGAGIFRTPPLVAASAGSENLALLIWLAGGFVSLIGALCYAELASTYPHAGGDYHYLMRAFGRMPAFIFGWARMSVIQTGSIAMLAFQVGDYASEIVRIGAYSTSFYASITVALLTGVNIAGVRYGKRVQNTLILTLILGLASVALVGLGISAPVPFSQEPMSVPKMESLGKAMIFVLLTYGGWNEGAYLSTEVRDARRNMVRVLLLSIGLITATYLVINLAFLRGLGLSAISTSDAVAADLMRRTLGENGARLISLLIVIATFSTINGMIITGARTSYALGQDMPLLGALGKWQDSAKTPVNALLFQLIVALLLILLGTGTRSGFVMMVDYTAPVFWFFILLVGISLFVLRRKERNIARPFRVPLYPVTPILFCAVCVYMLQASIAYTGRGALLGIGVLIAGIPLFLMNGHRKQDEATG